VGGGGGRGGEVVDSGARAGCGKSWGVYCAQGGGLIIQPSKDRGGACEDIQGARGGGGGGGAVRWVGAGGTGGGVRRNMGPCRRSRRRLRACAVGDGRGGGVEVAWRRALPQPDTPQEERRLRAREHAWGGGGRVGSGEMRCAGGGGVGGLGGGGGGWEVLPAKKRGGRGWAFR